MDVRAEIDSVRTDIGPKQASAGAADSGLAVLQPGAYSQRLLPVDSFGGLPREVRRALAMRECMVPQAFHPPEPHNIVSGEFAAPGQIDWAALCAREDSVELVILWGGPDRCSSPTAVSAYADFVQVIGPGGVGFSRGISAVSRQFIVDHAEEYGGPLPPDVDHQGIADAFVEKASVVHYCYRGRWMRLAGAD